MAFAQLDFAGPSGTNTDVVLGSDPLYLFELMFTDELVNHIATMTNNYARQCMAAPDFKLSDRMKKWKDVSVSEIRLMIGFILYQGIIRKPEYSSYFTSNKLFATPGIKNLLSYNRFVNIDRFLHFVDRCRTWG